jgi:hypothetical protein
MGDNLHADPIDEDWEDKNVEVHEIKVDVVEVTEDDDSQRIEIKPKRDGPAWKNTEDTETAPAEATTKKAYRPGPAFHNKKPPAKDKINFPGINEAIPDKTSNENSTEKKKEDHKDIKSNNRFEDLDEEDNPPKEPEEKKNPSNSGKKKKKSKKKEWKEIKAEIKVATTVLEKEKNIFDKEEVKKKIDYSDNQDKPKYESKGFGSKKFEDFGKAGEQKDEGIKRNYDYKPPEPRAQESKSFGGLVRSTEIKRRIDAPVENKSNDGQPTGWRSSKEQSDVLAVENISSGPKKKFFNEKKTKVQDPLIPKVQQPEVLKRDGWGEMIQDTKKTNFWQGNK